MVPRFSRCCHSSFALCVSLLFTSLFCLANGSEKWSVFCGDGAYVRETPSFACGSGISCVLNINTGVFTVSGNGPMSDFSEVGNNLPEWYDRFRDIILFVNITEGVTRVGAFAFYNCENLVSAKLSSSVTVIGDSAFRLSKKLKTVDFAQEGALKVIDAGAFEATGLTGVTIPNSVNKIGDGAFLGCDQMYCALLGSGVNELGNFSFGGGKLLRTVSFKGTQQPLFDSMGDPFYETPYLKVVRVSENYKDPSFCGKKKETVKKLSKLDECKSFIEKKTESFFVFWEDNYGTTQAVLGLLLEIFQFLGSVWAFVLPFVGACTRCCLQRSMEERKNVS